jgi:3-hydroxyisobutyrate dehydrogenase
MEIALIGIGRMGAAIAQRLRGVEHGVTAWNRSSAKAEALAVHGVKVAKTPADAARACEVIVSILADADAIESTYAGADGILAADLTGKLVIEMSTVRPETQRALAERVRARGAGYVECPVGGTVGPAKEGKLFGFGGATDADFARAKPLLEQMCRRVEHVGPVGSGAHMKLAINLPLLVYYQALGEALTLAKPLGLDAARLVDILADTSGAPTMIKTRGASFVTQLTGGDVPPTFDVDLIRKDLRTMIAEGAALGVHLPVAATALACYDEASKAGLGAKDATKLAIQWPAKLK